MAKDFFAEEIESTPQRDFFAEEIGQSDKPISSAQKLAEEGKWVQSGLLRTAEDIAAIPLNFANQFALNAPKSAIRTAMPGEAGKAVTEELFEPQSGVAHTLAHGAGIVGGFMSPINKLALAKGATLGARAGFGALSGALYAPEENITDVGQRAGQAVGGALVGGAIHGAGKLVNRFKPETMISDATSMYRDILRPTQGEVNKIEIRQGKNIDDFYKLAAEEGITIKKTPDNKIDTSEAVEMLKPKIGEIHDRLNEALASDTVPRFNLLEIGNKAKAELKKSVKNAREYENAVKDVDAYINAEVERFGELVNGETLNRIKQGMWDVSYKPLEPNAKYTARKIGNIAREAIEQNYTDENIRGLNQLSGKYQTLNTLLENAQGRVIKGGRLGGYFSSGIGALAGHATGLPVVGEMAGAFAGKKFGEFVTDPEMLSKIAASKASKAGIKGKSFMDVMGSKAFVPTRSIKPELLEGKERISFRSPFLLENLPAEGAGYKGVRDVRPIITPVAKGEGVITPPFKAEFNPLKKEGVANKVEQELANLRKQRGAVGRSSPEEEAKLRQLAEERVQSNIRNGGAIGTARDDEFVARERFDIPRLQKISFGGSDRDVYDLGNGNVLKVAKSGRGLMQNDFSTDYYAEENGLIPRTIEVGKNYIVKEKVEAPDDNVKKMVAKLKKVGMLPNRYNQSNEAYQNRNKFYAILDEHGFPSTDLSNYDPLFGDLTAIRNWGVKDGKPIMLDEGSLNGSFVEEYRKGITGGTKHLLDPEFRKVYYESKEAKKKFADVDKKTMYGIGSIVAGTTAMSMMDNADARARDKEVPENLVNNAEKMTQFFEDFKDSKYKDSRGVPTIGYGFNLKEDAVVDLLKQNGWRGGKLDKAIADKVFPILYRRSRNEAKEWLGSANFNKLKPEAQNIVIDMTYNLGGKINGFKRMKEALLKQDYKRASTEMKDSDWYNQVGRRSRYLVKKMANMNSFGKLQK